MMMLFALLLASVVVTVLSMAVFSTLDHQGEPRPEIRPELALDPPRFFADQNAQAPATGVPIPIELLLSQIAHHVRLEQAAAETFLRIPTPESLHSPSASPLLN